MSDHRIVVDAVRDLERLAVQCGFSRVDEIVGLAEPSIRLNWAPGTAPLGASRFGGEPDLPAGIQWPRSRFGVPLQFICQVRLTDVSQYDMRSLLPAQGLLSFFFLDPFNVDEHLPDGEPDPFDLGHVLYMPSVDGLDRRPPTEEPPGLSLREASLEAAPELTLPPYDSVQIDDIGLSEKELDAYYDLLAELEDSRGSSLHRMLGYQDEVQNELFSDFGRAAHGSYERQDMRNWCLLLQVSSDEELGTEWADWGRVYFGVTFEDLAAGRIDATGAVLQSH